MKAEPAFSRADKIIYPILFALSILFLYFWTLILTEGLLVPWDIIPGRPPLGDTQRTINDFFESPPGSLLSARIVLISTLLAFAWRMIKEPGFKLIREFTIANYTFFLVDLGIGLLVRTAQDRLNISDPWPKVEFNFTLIALTFILLSTLLWIHWRGSPDRVPFLSRFRPNQ